jgi:hypothetical protein
MFATIIIILPSEHTGGQVCVSHGTKKDTFDTAISSAVGFSLLAWYTDVKHKVKPITSGFRLALSYKLIHTARNTLPPSIPDSTGAIDTLTTVLRNWEQNRYGDYVEKVAYILDHEYSSKSLKRASLKGADAHLVAVLVRVCKKEALDINFHLACIEHTISGTADMDSGYGTEWMYGKGGKRRWGQSGFRMESFDGADTEILKVVTLDGNPVEARKFTLVEDDFMPKTVFEELDPDYTQYSGYMGNVRHQHVQLSRCLFSFAGSRRYELLCVLFPCRNWYTLTMFPVYHRSVLIISI